MDFVKWEAQSGNWIFPVLEINEWNVHLIVILIKSTLGGPNGTLGGRSPIPIETKNLGRGVGRPTPLF